MANKSQPGTQQPRSRAAYALPTIFTAGNIFLGFLSIMRSIQGAILTNSGYHGDNPHFEVAAVAIGWAFLLDGLDGRIARLTNTVSDFGRELDSLADVITFGLAPVVLAFAWGIQPAFPSLEMEFRDHGRALGVFIPFLFLLCGAARLARFNIQKNAVPTNPGRPDRKYFVGLPIPASAANIAAIVFAFHGVPITDWRWSAVWLALMSLLSFLMVSTWRYQSFKDMQLLRPRSPLLVVLLGTLIYMIWMYPQPVLLALSITYVASGVIVRAGGAVRRRAYKTPPEPEHQVG